MNNTRHLGRKLDDSLPDFATFVVSRFWKWGKRGDIQKNATKPDPLGDKKTRRSGFFRQW
ncbi:hypothetical protein J5T40_001257 [Escherichia fergusonii]|uniref:hypothetical protein n=1 Tax=Escherichia fergusonii TaxID=564 RepID=UPI0018AAF931|nr:hypothetical protein [Escherichia fergusonii]EHG6148873.1 hypothetical protein [Escherichia fergusonii]EHG6207087.1 hypothetical protein [Escherichia fergusonii]